MKEVNSSKHQVVWLNLAACSEPIVDVGMEAVDLHGRHTFFANDVYVWVPVSEITVAAGRDAQRKMNLWA